MTLVTIRDSDGNIIGSFQADADQSLGSQANMNGCNIPLACCAGACQVCACRVVAGAEFLDKEKFGYQLTSLDDDQICSCISGIVSVDPAQHIVLQHG